MRLEIFECDECGHKFKIGLVNLKKNTIFCPKCNREIESEVQLYECDCL
ncbi:MAG: hypothetical protein ACTSRI_02855 [Promethearchaeota archaeon]